MNEFKKPWIYAVVAASFLISQFPRAEQNQARCLEKKWTQPEGVITNKLDLLFVVDTSASLDAKRVRLANGIGSFVMQFSKDIDYQVAVTLAHSPKSFYSGKLFQRSGEPAVLRSSEMTFQQIKNNLVYKLNASILEGWADGGELGMASALQLLKPEKLAQIRANDKFFRSDAALVVIFISDENDICAVYPNGTTPRFDGDHLEARAKRLFCTGVTPETVAQRIREIQGNMPSLIGAVVYNDKTKVPRTGEDEYGYGYMELVEISSGISINIANANYTEGLVRIGQLASTKMSLYYDFVLPEPRVYPDSIVVKVDGIEVEGKYHPETNSVYVENPGKALSEIEVNYCLMGDNDSPQPNSSASPDTSCGLPDCNIIGI